MKRGSDGNEEDENSSKKQHVQDEEPEEVTITINPEDQGITFETIETIEGQEVNLIQGQEVNLQSIQGQEVNLENVEGQEVNLQNVEGQEVNLQNIQGQEVNLENVEGHLGDASTAQMTFTTVVDGQEVPLEVSEGQEVTLVDESELEGHSVHVTPLHLGEDGTVGEDQETLHMVVESGDGESITIPVTAAQEVSGIQGGMVEQEIITADSLQAQHGILVESVDEAMTQHFSVQQVDADGHIQQLQMEAVDGDGTEEGVLQVIEQADDMTVTLDESQFADEVGEDELEGQYQNIIIQHMDIAQPLSTLRRLLENRLHCSLADHEFYLQDQIQLSPDKSLASQCVQGTGMVQINVEVKSQPGIKPRLNIVDILKPAEEVVEMEEVVLPQPKQQQQFTLASHNQTTSKSPGKVVIPFPEEAENVTRWIVDQNFRKEQERLKIPFDPNFWNEAHVRHWIQWAIKEFKLEGVDVNSFRLSGQQLCDLRHDEFITFIPHDKGDVFWTHLELLRKCKFVAVIQQPTPHAITTITVSTSDTGMEARAVKAHNRNRVRSVTIPTFRGTSGNRTGNNGQIQLWQFLLELLTDKEFQEIIHWLGDEGEFKLQNPEMVAQLWGQRKNKPTMNYEKLSRALRYYYDGDMIAKVHGKRFVYKFVCDLTMLLGYTAGELNRLVSECAEKSLHKIRQTMHRPQMRAGILRRVVEK